MNSKPTPLLSAYRFFFSAFFSAVLIVPPASLMALPSDVQVSHGQIDLSQSLNQLNIDQLSPQAIANWGSFSIGAGEIVNINQLDAQSVLLNRVLGADPSQLMGQLNANGRVFLVNPNGIVVGQNASINTTEFLASALDISDADFLNGGDMLFSGDSQASVLNLGSITAENGDVIMIAYKVANEGTITADNGVAALAAGNEVLLSPEGDQRLLVKTDLGLSGAALENSGLIEAAQAELKAAGGNIYELAINQSGIVRATGIEKKNGRILITAEGGTIGLSGALAAANADGSGGEVLLGGDYRGENDAVANAARTVVTESGLIDVSAQADDADAGRAIVWADESTRFLGTIAGQGGALGGDGAFAEVSGKQFLDYRGLADLSAAAGNSGQLLLDPTALSIAATPADNALTETPGTPYTFENAQPGGSLLLVSTLENQLALSDVVLSTSYHSDFSQGDSSIAVEDAVSWTSGNDLIFQSANAIRINADLDAGAGNIVFGLGFFIPGLTEPDLSASLSVDAGASVTGNNVTIKRHHSGQFIANGNDGAIGAIDFQGILNVNTLDIQSGPDPEYSGSVFGAGSGIVGDVRIDNANNAIGTLTSSVNTGIIVGTINIVDSSGGLIVDAAFADVRGDLSIVTNGDLTLSSGAVLSTVNTYQQFVPGEGYQDFTGDFDVNLAAVGGHFINNAGSGAVDAGGTGRFLIYSDAPAQTTLGGLIGKPIYDKTYTADAPGSITQAGDRFLYSLAPTLTLTANSTSKEQGDANPTFTYSVSGLVGGDEAVDVFAGDPTLSSSANTSSPEGSYAIDIAQGSVELSDYGYGLSLVAGILSIDPAALQQLIIRADDLLRTFGDANPTFTASYDGFTTGQTKDLVSGLGFSTAAVPQSPVGDYTITPFGATADGFNIIFQPGTLTVNPRLLTVTAGSTSRLFGDENQAFSFGLDNLASFDIADAVGSNLSATSAAVRLSDVGNYPITVSGSVNSNYTLVPVAGNLQVEQRPLTFTVLDAMREYGDANPEFLNSTTSQVSGAPLGRDGLIFSTEATQSSNIGTYTVTPSGIINPNYAIDYVAGNLEVTQVPVTFRANNQDRQYGLANPALTYQDTASYKLGHTLSDVLFNFSITTPATQASNVGTYSIDLNADSTNPNYAVTLTDGTFTIQKAPLFVVPVLSSRLYGDPNPTSYELSATGLRNEDTVAVVQREDFQNFTPLDANVGTRGTVTIFSGTATNYDLTFGAGTMNILPRPLTITADGFTREYGEANPTLTAVFDGLASFDNASDITGLSFSTPAEQSAIAGRYGITPSSNSNSNYSITYQQGFAEITKAPLYFELSGGSRPYGDGNGFVLSSVDIINAVGFKLSDDASSVALSNIDSNASQQSDIGIYLITADAFSSKYELDFDPGLLEVTPRPLTLLVDRDEVHTRMYGDEPIDISEDLIVGNLASFDNLEDVVEIVDPTFSFTDIGEYEFVANIIDPNYSLTSFAQNNFFIQQRQLDLIFDGATRAYGDETPNLLIYLQTDGLFAPGDTPETVLGPMTTATNQRSDVGTYAISTGSINSNYGVQSITGGLTITPREVVIFLDPVTRIYGQENPTIFDSYLRSVGSLGLPSFENLNNVLEIITPSIQANVGEYTLAANLIDTNYSLSSFDGMMNIIPREISVDLLGAHSYSRIYAEPNPDVGEFTQLTYSGSPNRGIASFDTIDDVIRFDLPGVTDDAGEYFMQEIILQSSNYAIDLPDDFDFRFFVQPRPIDLKGPFFSRVYGEMNPALEYSDVTPDGPASGLALFDTLTEAVALVGIPDERSNVGSYGLQVASRNYSPRFVEGGQITVTPRPLVIIADDFTRAYGDDNGRERVNFILGAPGSPQGLASFDSEDDVIVRNYPTIESEVGEYELVLSKNNPNYSYDRIEGTGTVSPRPIHLQGSGFTRVYGADDPEHDAFAIIGNPASVLASFHSVADVFTLTEIDERTPAGEYSIFGFQNPNYEFTVDGLDQYEITKRPLYLTVSNQTRTYGDPVGSVSIRRTFTGTNAGPAPFDTLGEIVSANLPAADADVGRYDITIDLLDSNYSLNRVNGPNIDSDAAPYSQILQRFISVELPGIDRLYGDANTLDTVRLVTSSQPGFDTLPSFASITDVFAIDLPSISAQPGDYTVVKYLDQKNYKVSVISGSEDMTISKRILRIDALNSFRMYGDTGYAFDFAITGDGLAARDSVEDTVVPILSDKSEVLTKVGHYGILDVWVDTDYYQVDSFTPGIFTLLPRAVSMQIDDVSLNFDSLGELSDYLADENLVVNATLDNLLSGDSFDDAFPIIRYQIVEDDTVPFIGAVPTADNIVMPSPSEFSSNPDLSRLAISVKPSAISGASDSVTRTGSRVILGDSATLKRYITVFDGFNTEDGYLLSEVRNGEITLRVPSAVVEPDVTIANGAGINLGNIVLTESMTFSGHGPLVIGSGERKPPGLTTFFDGGNYDLGVDMITGLFESLMGEGEFQSFEEGSLFYEITRSTTGTLEDLTPFRIQRWFERNAGDPAAMALLSEPLSHYAAGFLGKDPDSYTDSESKFADLLSDHLENARDDVADRMQDKKAAWEKDEVAKGHNLADLAGSDIPWSDFMEDAAGEYVTEDVEAKVALAVGATAVGAGATAGVMVGLTAAVLPFAVTGGASIAAGATVTGVGTTVTAVTVVGLGTSTAGTGTVVATVGGVAGSTAVSAAAVVVVPVAIVTGAIVGSIARGFQVFNNVEQEKQYNAIQDSIGTGISVSDFDISDEKGKEVTLNQTIMLGALASMLVGS